MVYSDYGPDRETGAVCDYQLYDRIWQRVSPDLNPYPHLRDGGEGEVTPPEEVSSPDPVREERGLAPLPEAGEPEVLENCCLGAAAQGAADALRALLAEELAGSRCYMALSRQVCTRNAARILRRAALEKREAVQRLQAACYLVTGACCPAEVPLQRPRFRSMPEALRHCCRREACGSLAYQQAAEGTADPCLAALLEDLGRQARRRSDAMLRLLGETLC